MQTNASKLMTRLMVLVGAICLLSSILASPAVGAAYLKYDGIDGESKDTDHKDWIDILSASQSIMHPAGSSAASPAADPTDFVVTKYIDKSTPKLALACCNGQHSPRVIVEFTSDDQRHLTYLQIEMTNVLVTSYGLSSNSTDDPVPVDQVSLNFEKIKWTYYEYDAGGRLVAEHATSWDFKTNTSGISISPQ